MQRAGIALGSNLGNRLLHLQMARDMLKKIAAPEKEFLQASVYQTEPLLCPDGSPDFYNSVVEIGFDGDAFDLLDHTRAIERALGRTVNSERNAPRVIDLDLLYSGDQIINSELLELPHPRLVERLFVLQPVAEIRPALVLPGQVETIERLLAELISDERPLALVTKEW